MYAHLIYKRDFSIFFFILNRELVIMSVKRNIHISRVISYKERKLTPV